MVKSIGKCVYEFTFFHETTFVKHINVIVCDSKKKFNRQI